MKILFVTPYYKPYFGGIERVVEQLSSQFRLMYKAETFVLTSKWSFPRTYEPQWAKQEIIDRENIYRLNSFPAVAPPFFQVPLVWFSPVEIYRYLKSVRPDVIQLMSDRWFWTNYWAMFWAKRMGIPVCFSLSFHSLSKRQQWLRPVNFYLTSQADAVEVITSLEKTHIQKTYRTPPDKIHVIPWGITKPPMRTHRLPNIIPEVTILCVGRVCDHKGQLWLAQRYQQAQFRYKTHLLLVGSVESAEYKKRIESLALTNDKHITVIGEVTDEVLDEYYNRSDLFALYPEYEAFGLVFLEALSHGVPVLSHEVGALSEVLTQGALLAHAYDSSQVVLHLETLVNDAYKRKTLGNEGKKFVTSDYTWEQTAEQFMAVYRSVL